MPIFVVKRHGWSPNAKTPRKEQLNILKIRNRIQYLANGKDGDGGEDVDPRAPSTKDRVIVKVGKALISVDIDMLTAGVMEIISDGVKTSDIDNQTIKCAMGHMLDSLEYEEFASRLMVSAMHKETPSTIIDAFRYSFTNLTKTGEHAPMVRDDILVLVSLFEHDIERCINYLNDYKFSFFGLNTICRRGGGAAYLAKDVSGNQIERPQHMWMRVALEIHSKLMSSDKHRESRIGLDLALHSYKMMSWMYMTHATPTLINAGTRLPQLSSCMLVSMFKDSIDGIADTVSTVMKLAKLGAGVGIDVSNIRAFGSMIKSSGGISRGTKPMLKVFNEASGYIDQGGRRKASFAIYMMVWHSDFMDFVQMGRNTSASPEDRAHRLFYATTVDNVFMEACQFHCAGGQECWGPIDRPVGPIDHETGKRKHCPGLHYFMTPDVCPGLVEAHNEHFRELYMEYAKEGLYDKAVHASDIMYEIIFTMINSGKMYVFNKDAANRSSNLSNVAPIKMSNLCIEITLPSGPEDIGVCNLASIALQRLAAPSFDDTPLADYASTPIKAFTFDGKATTRYFSFKALEHIVTTLVTNLDNLIDRTLYPEEKTERSNQSMRPIGIGVQGLADVFSMLGLPYESDKARVLNYHIWRTMYYAAMKQTICLAKDRGPYPLCFTNGASPAINGKLQFDTWPEGERPANLPDDALLFDNLDNVPKYDWDELRADAAKHGMRNSMLLANMPTASTSQILGSSESFEPYTTNIYSRNTIAGQFQVVNPQLAGDLTSKGMWNRDVVDQIIAADGSVQYLDDSVMPLHAKRVYKTAYEISKKRYIQMAADRARFICHSQSMNLYWSGEPDQIKHEIYSALVHGWRLGLKTLCYYTHINTMAKAQKVTIDPAVEAKVRTFKEQLRVAKEAAERGEVCDMCSG